MFQATAERPGFANSGVDRNLCAFRTGKERPFGVRLEHVTFHPRPKMTA
jgi:hypothetical protein